MLYYCRYIMKPLGGVSALCHLLWKVKTSELDPVYIAIQAKLCNIHGETQGNKTIMIWLRIATALDPRFKDLKCLHRAEKTEVWILINDLLTEESPVHSANSELPMKKQATPRLLQSLTLMRNVWSAPGQRVPSAWKALPSSEHEGLNSSLACNFLATPDTRKKRK